MIVFCLRVRTPTTDVQSQKETRSYLYLLHDYSISYCYSILLFLSIFLIASICADNLRLSASRQYFSYVVYAHSGKCSHIFLYSFSSAISFSAILSAVRSASCTTLVTLNIQYLPTVRACRPSCRLTLATVLANHNP